MLDNQQVDKIIPQRGKERFTTLFITKILCYIKLFVSFSYLRMIELAEELFLVHDWVDTAFTNDSSLGHLLHGIQFFVFAMLDLPNFTETASTDHILPIEVILVRFWIQIKDNKVKKGIDRRIWE